MMLWMGTWLSVLLCCAPYLQAIVDLWDKAMDLYADFSGVS